MRKLTQTEKEQLICKVSDLCIRDAFTLKDYAEMMRICRDAYERRIAEIEAEIPTPVGKTQ